MNVAYIKSDSSPWLHQEWRSRRGQECRDFLFRPRPVKNDGQVLVLSRAHRWSVFLVSPLESGSISISNSSFVLNKDGEGDPLLLVELERIDPMV